MKLLAKRRQMDKRPLLKMTMTTTSAAAASFLYFLLLFLSISTTPTSATIKGKIDCFIFTQLYLYTIQTVFFC